MTRGDVNTMRITAVARNRKKVKVIMWWLPLDVLGRGVISVVGGASRSRHRYCCTPTAV